MENLSILFQNKNVVVVIKPAGVLSVPDRHASGRFVLGLELEKKFKLKIFPVHRLDFEVEGPMLFALSTDAHRDFNLAFENHTIEKTYHAIGVIDPSASNEEISGLPGIGKEVIWNSKLVRGKKRTFEAPHGKDSETKACLLSREKNEFGEFVHVKLWPITGRSHQLRFEMMKHQIPILGDTLYSSPVLDKSYQNKIALHAIELKIASDLARKWEIPDIFRGPSPTLYLPNLALTGGKAKN